MLHLIKVGTYKISVNAVGRAEYYDSEGNLKTVDVTGSASVEAIAINVIDIFISNSK